MDNFSNEAENERLNTGGNAAFLPHTTDFSLSVQCSFKDSVRISYGYIWQLFNSRVEDLEYLKKKKHWHARKHFHMPENNS